MNPQWDTPPNGDFARYVERLTAQAVMPHRVAPQGDRALDAGMTSTSGAADSTARAVAAAQRQAGSNADTGSNTLEPNRIPAWTKLAAVIGGLLVLAGMSEAGAPGVLVALLIAGLWVGRKALRNLASPGPAKWQKVLEEAARAQAEQRGGQS